MLRSIVQARCLEEGYKKNQRFRLVREIYTALSFLDRIHLCVDLLRSEPMHELDGLATQFRILIRMLGSADVYLDDGLE